MADIGTAYIRIAPNMTGIQGRIAGGLKGTGDKFSQQFGNEVKGRSSVIAGAVAGVAAAAASKAIGLVSNSIGAAIKRVDTLRASGKTFEYMGFTAAEAKQATDDLEKSIRGLPTPLDSAMRGMTGLAATYGDVRLGQKVFTSLNNAILGFGGSADMVENAIQQLSQLPLDGPLDAQTWNSLRNSGLTPVLVAMSKDFGMSVGDMKKAFGEGQLTVQDFTDKLTEMNTKGGGGLVSLEKIAKNATGGIGTGFANLQTAVVRGMAKIITSIGSENISRALSSIGNAFEKVFTVLSKILADTDVQIAIATAAIAGLGYAIWGALPAVWAFLSPLLPFIAAFGALVGVIKLVRANWATIAPVIDKVKQGFIVFWNTIKPIRDFIANQFKAAFNDLRASFESIKKTLAPFMPQLKVLAMILGAVLLAPLLIVIATIGVFTAALVAVITVVARVIGWLSKLGAIFWKITAAIVTAVSNRINAVINIFRQIGGRISRSVGNLGNLLYNAGRDIVNGLIRGIQNRISAAIGTVKGVAGKISGAFKSALGIQSPSKVFASFGKDIDRGLALGINKNAGVVAKAVDTLSNTAITGMVTNMPTPSAQASTIPGVSAANGVGNLTNQSVSINSIVLGDQSAVKEFFKQLNQDTINIGMGITPIQGANG